MNHKIWIEIPKKRRSCFEYVLEILRSRMAIEGFEIRFSCANRVTIGSRFSNIRCKFPSEFLTIPDEQWLKKSSLPNKKFRYTKVDEFFPDMRKMSPLPVLFGDGGDIIFNTNQINIPIDIIGTIFFFLTRYEEYVIQERDELGRFDIKHSCLDGTSIYTIPIVDYYIKLLSEVLRVINPYFEVEKNNPSLEISCDLDHPFFYSRNFKQISRRLAGDLIHRKSARIAINSLWNALTGNLAKDIYFQAIQYIMDVNEKNGNRVTFYIIPACSHANDNQNSMGNYKTEYLLKMIHERNHCIGIHPGFSTSMCEKNMKFGINEFIKSMDKLGIDCSKIISRQHYLRWDIRTTPYLLAKSGVREDSTLGFNGQPGFRAGTCHKFPLFDPENFRLIGLIESPLVLMEWSLLSPNYMNIQDVDKLQEIFKEFGTKCYLAGGNFTVLWHNNNLLCDRNRMLYENLIDGYKPESSLN